MVRKVTVTALFAILMATTANAQNERSAWTLNTRAWSTNYFTTMIGALTSVLITDVIGEALEADSLVMDHIVPLPDIVFPVGLEKEGFNDPLNIYGPYHYDFGNPFKHPGDYGIGLDLSWKPTMVGLYAGAYFKSQEIVYDATDKHLRAFYFQPRGGLILGSDKTSIEAGVFYDVVTGCRYDGNSANKDQLKNGLGLDFAVSYFDKGDKSSTTLQFMMPLHNMLNSDVVKRRVGYIMVTRRVSF